MGDENVAHLRSDRCKEGTEAHANGRTGGATNECDETIAKWQCSLDFQICGQLNAGFRHAVGRFYGRPVLDRTGLKGSFDFTLQWESEPDEPSNGGPGLLASRLHLGPSMFTAIEESLGLKLEPMKGPVEVLVIDHVEQPSGN